jgi:MFS family permease
MRRLLISLSFFAPALPALMLLLVYVGDSWRAPLITTPIFAALLTAALLSSPREDGGPVSGWWADRSTARWTRAAALVAGALLAVLLFDRPYQQMSIYPHHTIALWVTSGTAFALLLALSFRPPRPAIALAAIGAAGLAVRACGIFQWEIDPARRDMLPLVIDAIDSLLNGECPYGLYQMQVGSQVPLTYPPGLWLLHLPARVAGLDVRWTGWLADAAIVASLGSIALRAGAVRAGAVLLGLATYLFLPDTHWNGIYAEPHADWAVLALLATAVATRRPLAASIVMGVALTTRPFNLALAPLLAIWLARCGGRRWLLRGTAVGGAIAAAVYLPFVLWDPDAFFLGTVRWLLEYGAAHSSWFHGMLGVSGVLYERGLESWMLPLQLGGLVAIYLLAAFFVRSSRGLLGFFCGAYAWVVAFNSIIWMSFWIGACLLAIARAGVRRAGDERSFDPPRFSRAALVAEWAALAFAALSLAAMLGLLWRHFDDSGIDEVRATLKSELESGDRVMDLSGYRVAFLDEPTLLARGEIPPGAELALSPFQIELPRRRLVDPVAPERIWVVERFGLFDRYEGIFFGRDVGPYQQAELWQPGRFRLLRLERRVEPGRHRRLVENVEAFEVAAELADGESGAVWRDGSWIFPGRPARQRVGRGRCRFGRLARLMIRARPLPDGTLVIRSPVAGGPRWVTLYGGLRRGAPQWGRADVSVALGSGEARLGEMVFRNEPGLNGISLLMPPDAEELTVRVSAPDPARRHLCLDAVFSD